MSVRPLSLAVALALSSAIRAMSADFGGWPLITNISARETQIPGAMWSMAEAPSGEIVVGGNKLAIFGGHAWRPVETGRGYAFRGLAAGADGRVWVGGTGQLGVLEKKTDGRWHFLSLFPEAQAAGANSTEEIWQVAMDGAGPVFVSSQRVLRWDGEKFTGWLLPCAPRLFAHTIRGRVFVHQPGTGLLRLDAAGPVLLRPAGQLPDGLILWAVAPGDSDDVAAGWLVGTNDGAFRLSAASFEKLPELSRALEGQLSTCATLLPDSTLAVGTYQRGVVLADPTEGRVRAVYDRRAGLADDHVNQLMVDRRGRLWTGLSLGLAQIEATDRVSLLDARNGLAEGPVMRVFALGEERFAATSKTVYRLAPGALDLGTARLESLAGLNTYVWDTAVCGTEIFAGGFGGLWRRTAARDGDWQHEHHVSADVFCVVNSRFLASTLLFFEGHALKALQRTERDWVPRTLVPDLGDTPVSLIEDSGGDVWVSLMIGGVRRYRIVDDIDGLPLGVRLIRRCEPGVDLPAGTVRPRLSLLGSRIVVFTESAILAMADRERDGIFTRVVGLEDWLANAGAVVGSEGWWILSRRDAGPLAAAALFRVTDTGDDAALRVEPFDAPGIERLTAVTSVDVQTDSPYPVLWVGGTHGLLRVVPVPAGPSPILQLYQDGNDASARGGAEPAFAGGNLELSLFSPAAAAGEPVLFQTLLAGAETAWSPLQREPERRFVGLAAGRYTLQARAVDRWGRAEPPKSLGFTVPAPWYRRGAAMAGYVIGGLLLVGMIAGLRIRHLHRHAAELDRLVAERTRELAMANTAKTEFLETISHEIRNPLNGVLGLVSMIRESAPAPREQELARTLQACTSSLARVFNQVLDFAKLEHGQIAVRADPFALNALLEDAAAVFRVTAGSRGCEISVRQTGHAGDRFVGDAEKIASILSNFLSNAVKYAPGQPIDLHVHLEACDDYGADVAFNVTDRGPGILPEEQELIFQKFVRGAQARQARAPGTGLGLATCRALAELMGGHVGVESEVGGGATFFLTLRLKRDRLETAASIAPSAPVIPVNPRKRALVVEDQPYNRIVVRRIAEQLGFATDVAENARAAMDAFRREEYDVILVDWELPDQRGDEVVREIRRLRSGHKVVVLATTAHGAETVRREALAAGIDAFALKPFDVEDVARLLHEARQKRAQAMTRAALDARVFHFVGEDDPAKSEQAATLYLEILAQELAALAGAAREHDPTAMARAAHRIKSHAGLVSAVELRDAADRLQREATGADPSGLSNLHEQIVRHSAVLRGQVEAWLRTVQA